MNNTLYKVAIVLSFASIGLSSYVLYMTYNNQGMLNTPTSCLLGDEE